MTYKFKYARTSKKRLGEKGLGAPVNPDKWCYSDPEQRDQYYALLKHRAQAKHRGETHSITPEEWFALWQDCWHLRGRGADNLCLCKTDPLLGWHVHNVEIMPRKEFLKRKIQDQNTDD